MKLDDWIEIKSEDDWPDDGAKVLARHDTPHGPEMFTAIFSRHGYTTPDWAIIYGGHVDDVTHYMPLPEDPVRGAVDDQKED